MIIFIDVVANYNTMKRVFYLDIADDFNITEMKAKSRQVHC